MEISSFYLSAFYILFGILKQDWISVSGPFLSFYIKKAAAKRFLKIALQQPSRYTTAAILIKLQSESVSFCSHPIFSTLYFRPAYSGSALSGKH